MQVHSCSYSGGKSCYLRIAVDANALRGLPAFVLVLLAVIVGGCHKVKPTVFTSGDGLVQITAFSDMRHDSSLNNVADLQIGNGTMYVIVLNESLVSDESEIPSFVDYDRLVRANIATAAKLSAIKSTTIDGHTALLGEVQGNVDGMDFAYLIATINSGEHYHQIIGWTQAKKFDKYRERFGSIVNSFRVVGSLPDSKAIGQSNASERIVAETCRIAAELLDVDQQTIQPQTTLSELGADELDLVELVMSLEDELNVSIPDEAISKIVGDESWEANMGRLTMKDLARVVEACKSQQVKRVAP